MTDGTEILTIWKNCQNLCPICHPLTKSFFTFTFLLCNLQKAKTLYMRFKKIKKGTHKANKYNGNNCKYKTKQILCE